MPRWSPPKMYQPGSLTPGLSMPAKDMYTQAPPLTAALIEMSGVPPFLPTFLTALQKWVSPGLLGRVMGTLMLCAFGTFPLSVAVAGVLVRHLGPAVFFPVAGGLVAMAILGGLTQREFRMFGATGSADAQAAAATKAATGFKAAAGSKAAEGSRK